MAFKMDTAKNVNRVFLSIFFSVGMSTKTHTLQTKSALNTP